MRSISTGQQNTNRPPNLDRLPIGDDRLPGGVYAPNLDRLANWNDRFPGGAYDYTAFNSDLYEDFDLHMQRFIFDPFDYPSYHLFHDPISSSALYVEMGPDFPLRRYASHNLLYHADNAEASGMPQQGFLASFDFARLIGQLTQFGNAKAMSAVSQVTGLYILAAFDVVHLISVRRPSAAQCMKLELSPYGCPLFAAAATGSKNALQLFTELVSAVPTAADRSQAMAKGHLPTKPIRLIAQLDFNFSKKKGLLRCASESNNDAFLADLIRSTETVKHERLMDQKAILARV